VDEEFPRCRERWLCPDHLKGSDVRLVVLPFGTLWGQGSDRISRSPLVTVGVADLVKVCGRGPHLGLCGKEARMRGLPLMSGLALLSMLSGCIPSLHPLYTEKDLIFEPALLGHWAEAEPKDMWHFEKTGEKRYRLTHTDRDGKTGRFEARLLRIRNEMFLDLFPEKPKLVESDFLKQHFLPTHAFIHVRQITPVLQMRILQLEWLRAILKEDPSAIRHEELVRADRIVLTAPPLELQEFLLKHLSRAGAFDDLGAMRRVPAAL
jgi:hypothetical protein